MTTTVASTRFQRWILPGLAFKAAVIGGGYATGRELAEYFIPSGPQGGVAAIVVAMLAWSAMCALTFAFAHATRSYDYHTFFAKLLGPFAFVFELAYLVFMVLILAVFGAAAGAIGHAVFGWPTLVGTSLLMVGIGAFTAYGNQAVERLFKWVSFFLYGVYVLFAVFVLAKFGGQAAHQFSTPVSTEGWLAGGLTYAGYNIVGAVMILPLARHFLTQRDAMVAGVLAGPLAMLPGLLFFVCMIAWYPTIGAQALPSDFMLRQLDMPVFHLLFQAMIFSALLESGAACVHAANERVAAAWRTQRATELSKKRRFTIAAVLLVGSIFIADRFGLVDLIARGYRALAWLFLVVYVLPLLTVGVWRLRRRAPRPLAAAHP